MRDDFNITAKAYNVVIITLDSHAAGPVTRASLRLAQDFPGLRVTVHAAAEWGENPETLQKAKAAIALIDSLESPWK